MWKILVLAMLGLAAARQSTFENYKVMRIHPTQESQLEVLHEMEQISDDYSFWNGPTVLNRTVDLMVAPGRMSHFIDIMNRIGASYKVYIENVQTLINEEKLMINRASGSFAFNEYHTLNEIYQYLESVAKAHPDKVEVVVAGKTYENRDIKGIKLSFGKNKPGIVIESGIHAREWITPATVLYIIDQLLNSNVKEVRDMAERHDWYIFPVFNPDGFSYTHTNNRLWRKSRKPYSSICHGSDLNRNWDFKWMNGGSSSNPCAETFAGTAPYSDIETATLSKYLTSISDKFYAYISFHSYSQLLLFPYGHTTAHLENYDELKAIGVSTIDALKKRYGTRYITGNIAETIYVATGSTVDWVKGHLGKDIAYTYELRDTGRYGFLLPASQIIPNSEEVLDSLVALFKEAAARGHPK